MSPVRIAISNLAWGREDEARAFSLLSGLSIQGIEVAPSKIAPWADLTSVGLKKYVSLLDGHGLVVSSLQAITFGVEDISLFGEEAHFTRLVDHLARVADVGAQLGAEVAVFGAPKIRSRQGLSEAEAFDVALDHFGQIADRFTGSGVRLVVEPVPAAYGNDFLPNSRDVTDFVRALDRVEIALHLDTGCALLANDDIADAIDEGRAELRHFHVAEPGLGNFDAPRADHEHASQKLAKIGYAHWISIEMQAGRDIFGDLVKAGEFVLKTYGR